MKYCMTSIGTALLIFVSLVCLAQVPSLTGAWEHREEGDSTIKVVLFEDGHFVQTTYNPQQKQFIESVGGTYGQTDHQLTVGVEFHTGNPYLAGQTAEFPLHWNGETFTISINPGEPETWERIDDGKGPLAGTWQIVKREQDGQMQDIPAGDRKTLKILSGARFQWIAVNTATGGFFGTGGGTYTYENGKYTENIAFFSRDSTRVGQSLQFDDTVKEGKWYHKGKSTKGDPVYEIWEKARL